MCSLALVGSFNPEAVGAAVDAVRGENVDVVGADVIVREREVVELEVRATEEFCEREELREALVELVLTVERVEAGEAVTVTVTAVQD